MWQYKSKKDEFGMKETIQLLREGDKKAFEELFDTNYQALCRYAYSILKDGVEAEDMVQRVFCKIWDKRSELEIHTSIKSYLYRIVHNECLNYVQQQANRAVINVEFFYSAAKISDNVNEQLNATELQQVIETAISKLAPQCRKVFELSRWEQLTYAEIAAKLQISVNTVENHISKALRHMRVALKDYLVIILFIINLNR